MAANNEISEFLTPAEAARRLGVSAKALRLYEERGLLSPARTGAGWRAYGAEQMARAAEIAALRELGLSLEQVARVLDGDPQSLEPALAAHEASLEAERKRLAENIAAVRRARAELARGAASPANGLARAIGVGSGAGDAARISFDLPWPWGGERFELREIRPITYISGPLGSGKTVLAKRLAEALPDGEFLGLERLDDGDAARARLARDSALKHRVDAALNWLEGEGAAQSDALLVLLIALEASGPGAFGSGALVIDLLEQGLDQPTQRALIAFLRRRASNARPGAARPVFAMTRSVAILDLDQVGAQEAIIFCPANHSPPFLTPPIRGAAGYEALESCLATPEVRARTEGARSWVPEKQAPAA